MHPPKKEIDLRIPPTPVYRRIAQIDAPNMLADRVQRVAGARVALINHALLQRDFPGLAGKGAAADRRRERWLLDNAGIMSVTQSAQTVTSSPIPARGPARKVWRPDTYGRAVIVPVTDPDGARGLLDVKGAGVRPGKTSSLKHHSSGLCLLREVFREVLFQIAIDRLFARARSKFWTLPVYGVIDLGFDGKTRRGERVPAGQLVRRAHRRPIRGFQMPWQGSQEERLHFEIELLLRHCGITSCHRGSRIAVERKGGDLIMTSAFGSDVIHAAVRAADHAYFPAEELPNSYEALNIQLTRLDPVPNVRAQLVDFGHYEMRSRFEHALVSTVHDGPILWGAKLLCNDPAFVQPDAALCLREDYWGVGPTVAPGDQAAGRSLTARPWLWTDRLAKDFRDRCFDSGEIFAALRNFGGEPNGVSKRARRGRS